MANMQQDVRALIKRAKKKGVARATFSMCYRVTLYSRPWRLMVIPMPAQSPDDGGALDPLGTSWDLGATITATLIGSSLPGAGEFESIVTPATVGVEPKLVYAYEWREPRGLFEDAPKGTV